MVSDLNNNEELDSLDDDGMVEELPAVGEGEMEAAPEMRFAKTEQPDQEEEQVLVKYCLFCREVIPPKRIACKHCGHVLHIFEGKTFKQLYWFFWGALITFVGCLLPFFNGVIPHEGQSPEVLLSIGCTTLGGGFYLIFSLLLLAAWGSAIYAKRFIVSPVFLLFIPAIHTWIVLVKRIAAESNKHSWYEFLYNVDALNFLAKDVGVGFLLVLIGSTLVSLTFIASIVTAMSGGDKGKGTARPVRRGRR